MAFGKIHLICLPVLLICTMVLCTGFGSTAACAEIKSSGSEVTENGIVYRITDAGAKVVGYTKKPVDLTIPENIGGHAVVSICADAFSGCSSLKSVSIPRTVEELEDGNYTLEHVTYVPHGAFANCTALKTVHIPSDSNLSYIGKCSFANCSALASITLPLSVRVLGLSCFEDCSALKSLTLPEGVETVEQNALSSTGIQTLRLPASLKSFHPWTYMYELQEIIVAEGNSQYKSIDGVLYEKAGEEWCALIYPVMKKNEEFILPEGHSLYAFQFGMHWMNGKVWDLPYLRSINIGKGKLDDPYAVIYTINVDDDNPYYTSVNGVLYDKEVKNVLQISRYTDKHIVIPEGVTTIMDAAGEYSDFSSIALPSSLRTIGVYAFSENQSIAAVTIPSGVKNIEYGAFDECSALSRITIPRSVTYIDEDAIPKRTKVYCYKGSVADQWARAQGNKIVYLKEQTYVLPGKLKHIEEEAFAGLPVTVITCPEGLVSIGPRAFADCASLFQIYIPESCESISKTAFEGCSDALTILGKADSKAEEFAELYGYTFVELR